MEIYFAIFSVLFFIVCVKLYLTNSKLKNQHQKNILELQKSVETLLQNHEKLSQKITISYQYKILYQQEMEMLGREIFLLQKMLFKELNKQ
ncbi:hypothetical protein [Flavobacterium croceum]|uniref:hypothetical protein n=1 Tax=Flavobacterium croceum TaxID=370975 RepID=UPI0024A85E14|nr:hypothetical protein [Flavobacterium croceum]